MNLLIWLHIENAFVKKKFFSNSISCSFAEKITFEELLLFHSELHLEVLSDWTLVTR